MDLLTQWSKLFTKSTFFAINKESDLEPTLSQIQSKLVYSTAVDSFHSSRKKEFLLGRVCAYICYEELTQNKLFSLPTNQDRSPHWPIDVVGTISHNNHWVGAAVAFEKDLIGIGMDFEVLGRTNIRLENHIRSARDIKTHPLLSKEELLTVIFSCKESLYKALHPKVKRFFGFEDAALIDLDLNAGVFTLELLIDLGPHFGPRSKNIFMGRIDVSNKICLSVIEVLNVSYLKEE